MKLRDYNFNHTIRCQHLLKSENIFCIILQVKLGRKGAKFEFSKKKSFTYLSVYTLNEQINKLFNYKK